MSKPVKVGIIGGSGLNNPELFSDASIVKIKTEFGDPSDGEMLEGFIEGVPCVLLARHGKKHTIMPTDVNYRANLLAMKDLGCTHVLVSTACGSLRENFAPGDFVIIDQFIDWTTKRKSTFYDGTAPTFKGILHLPMDTPFCPRTRSIVIDSCSSLGYSFHSKGTVVTIEGPRFSSRAESNMFRLLGADVINMTTMPEVALARELGMCYASIAMATDYDCWKTEDSVSVEKVLAIMKSNAMKATEVIKRAVAKIGQEDWADYLMEMQANVRSNILLPR